MTTGEVLRFEKASPGLYIGLLIYYYLLIYNSHTINLSNGYYHSHTIFSFQSISDSRMGIDMQHGQLYYFDFSIHKSFR